MKTEIKKERFIKALKNEIPRNKFIEVVYYICLENYKTLLRNLKILISKKRYHVLDSKTLHY